MPDAIIGMSPGRIVKCVHKHAEYRLVTRNIEVAASCFYNPGLHVHFVCYSFAIYDLKTGALAQVVDRKWVGCRYPEDANRMSAIATAIAQKNKPMLEAWRMEAML